MKNNIFVLMGLQKVEGWETTKVESWMMLVGLEDIAGMKEVLTGNLFFSFVVDYSLHCHIDSNILGQGYLILSAEMAEFESLKILLCYLCLLLKWKYNLRSWNLSLCNALPEFC